MANNVLANVFNPLVYVGAQPLRFIGTPQAGETDGRSILTSTNTKQVYFWTSTGSQQTGAPGNAFSTKQVINPGEGVAIVGRTSFELQNFLPLPDSTQQAAALTALQSVISGGASPSPTPTPGTTPQGTIAFTAPTAGASLTAGNITISGTYTLASGSFTNGIQYRWNGGAWTALVASPTGGTFSASANITAAATGALEVRFADNTAVTASRNITIAAASGGSPGTLGSGTAGTVRITSPTSGASVASGNVTIGVDLTIASGQTVSSLEWQFNNSAWTVLQFAPAAGAVSKAVAIDNPGTGLLKVRFNNEQTIVSEVSITVTAPAAAPAAVATQSIGIAANGFTATELTNNWNSFVSVGGTEQIVNNAFLPTGNTNSATSGRASYKVPFAITSTTARFNLAAKVVLNGVETGGGSTPTAQANYQQGFGIAIHNDPTPELTANINQNFGVRDLTKSIALEFNPVGNQIQLWRNPSNSTFVGGANATTTAVNGIIYGDVYVWVDLVQTTHVLNVFVANTNTKPGTPDLTLDLDGAASIGALATYFGNQAFLALGGNTLFTAAQSNGQKPYRFETLTFTANNA